MTREDIIRMAREAGAYEPINKDDWAFELPDLERFAALVVEAERDKYSPIGKVAGGAGDRTFMHPSVRYILPVGLQLYSRIEVREEDKV